MLPFCICFCTICRCPRLRLFCPRLLLRLLPLQNDHPQRRHIQLYPKRTAACRLRLALQRYGVDDITAAEAIAEKGYSDKYGARNLRRVIQTDIEDVIALKIIESYKNPVSEVTLSKDGDGRIAVSFA